MKLPLSPSPQASLGGVADAPEGCSKRMKPDTIIERRTRLSLESDLLAHVLDDVEDDLYTLSLDEDTGEDDSVWLEVLSKIVEG